MAAFIALRRYGTHSANCACGCGQVTVLSIPTPFIQLSNEATSIRILAIELSEKQLAAITKRAASIERSAVSVRAIAAALRPARPMPPCVVPSLRRSGTRSTETCVRNFRR